MIVHLKLSLQKLRPDADQIIVCTQVMVDGRVIESRNSYVGVDNLVARVEPLLGGALQKAARELEQKKDK